MINNIEISRIGDVKSDAKINSVLMNDKTNVD